MKPFEKLSYFEYNCRGYLIINRIKAGREIFCIYMPVPENMKEYNAFQAHPEQYTHRTSLKVLKEYKKKGYIYNIRPAQI